MNFEADPRLTCVYRCEVHLDWLNTALFRRSVSSMLAKISVGKRGHTWGDRRTSFLVAAS